jgi:hypothetical protein
MSLDLWKASYSSEKIEDYIESNNYLLEDPWNSDWILISVCQKVSNWFIEKYCKYLLAGQRPIATSLSWNGMINNTKVSKDKIDLLKSAKKEANKEFPIHYDDLALNTYSVKVLEKALNNFEIYRGFLIEVIYLFQPITEEFVIKYDILI